MLEKKEGSWKNSMQQIRALALLTHDSCSTLYASCPKPYQSNLNAEPGVGSKYCQMWPKTNKKTQNNKNLKGKDEINFKEMCKSSCKVSDKNV